jgi:hypothetical protein
MTDEASFTHDLSRAAATAAGPSGGRKLPGLALTRLGCRFRRLLGGNVRRLNLSLYCLLPLESTPPWRETADEARADLAVQLMEIAAGIMNQAEMVILNGSQQQTSEEE